MKIFPATIALLVLMSCPVLRAQQSFIPPAASPTPAIQSGGEVAARTAADVWLALVDDARYDAAYDASAGIFQKLMTKDHWAELATAGRGKLGKLVSRNFKDVHFTRTLPGAPEGQYVVIRFNTSFEKKPNQMEIITPTLDPSGEWKICGYFIKRPGE